MTLFHTENITGKNVHPGPSAQSTRSDCLTRINFFFHFPDVPFCVSSHICENTDAKNLINSPQQFTVTHKEYKY